MESGIKPISKAMYDRAKANHGYLTDDDIEAVFSDAERLGYGIYSPIVCERNGYYFVEYDIGSTCD